MAKGIQEVEIVVDGRVFLLKRDLDRDDRGLVCVEPAEPLSKQDAFLLLSVADLVRPVGCQGGGY